MANIKLEMQRNVCMLRKRKLSDLNTKKTKFVHGINFYTLIRKEIFL